MRSFPDPEPMPETKAFWSAAGEGRFLVRFCNACDRAHWYPRTICPFCSSSDTDWRPGSGGGTVYSFSIMRRVAEPFVMAYVKLDEGPILMSNIVDCDIDTVHVDQTVSLIFKLSESGFAIPCFTPMTIE